jgi:hypothetical protein
MHKRCNWRFACWPSLLKCSFHKKSLMIVKGNDICVVFHISTVYVIQSILVQTFNCTSCACMLHLSSHLTHWIHTQPRNKRLSSNSLNTHTTNASHLTHWIHTQPRNKRLSSNSLNSCVCIQWVRWEAFVVCAFSELDERRLLCVYSVS